MLYNCSHRQTGPKALEEGVQAGKKWILDFFNSIATDSKVELTPLELHVHAYAPVLTTAESQRNNPQRLALSSSEKFMVATGPPVCVSPVMNPMSKETATSKLLPVVVKLSETVPPFDCPVK
jgi:hypothetical protein